MIESWTIENLYELRGEEDDKYEFKSCRCKNNELAKKISIAASAFWNSGGGIFIVGMGDDGNIEEGISSKVGRQSLRDWVDIAIAKTEPNGEYIIQTIELSEDRVILVIEFIRNGMTPFMAYNHLYYIRAGAHSVSASHFQVEALRALRQYAKPNLRGVFRMSRTKSKVVELVIACLNNSTAFDVCVNFEPLPAIYQNEHKEVFPLTIPFIDKENPFVMEISIFLLSDQTFGSVPLNLELSYLDSMNKSYNNIQRLDLKRNKQPLLMGDDMIEKLVEAINKLTIKLP